MNVDDNEDETYTCEGVPFLHTVHNDISTDKSIEPAPQGTTPCICGASPLFRTSYVGFGHLPHSGPYFLFCANKAHPSTVVRFTCRSWNKTKVIDSWNSAIANQLLTS